MLHPPTWAPALIALCLASTAAPAAAQGSCLAPQVLIVLDKSSSMVTGTTPSGLTKWEAARAAVTNLVADYGDRIDFGLMLFPEPDLCAPGSVVLDVGPVTAAEVDAFLLTPPPDSGNYTPMAETLWVAANYAPLADADRLSYVLLITDGWQWCDPYDPATRFAAVDAVDALAAGGVDTFVLGFGGAVDALNNNLMAVAGGRDLFGCDPNGDDPAATDLCYFQTDSQGELETAFGEIALQVTEESCDGEDNDCDGLVDNAVPGAPGLLTRVCGDGCPSGEGEATCVDGDWSACEISVACDDGNACTSGDWCDGEGCLGQAISCDDGVACTTDGCDPTSGCAFSPIDSACDDAIACTVDTCDPTSGCALSPVDSACDDAIACTVDTCDPTQGCLHLADPTACDDDDPCTADSCQPSVGCSNLAIPDCEPPDCSGDACDPTVCSGEGCACVADTSLCNDHNECTDDYCDSQLGCVYDFNTLPCNDDDSCTTDDRCDAGACVGGEDTCPEESRKDTGVDNGCRCNAAGSGGGSPWLGLFLLLAWRRWRRR